MNRRKSVGRRQKEKWLKESEKRQNSKWWKREKRKRQRNRQKTKVYKMPQGGEGGVRGEGGDGGEGGKGESERCRVGMGGIKEYPLERGEEEDEDEWLMLSYHVDLVIHPQETQGDNTPTSPKTERLSGKLA